MENLTVEQRALLKLAIDKVIEQGSASINPQTRRCMYRGSEGKKCAIGHLIKDEFMDPDLEGKGVTGPGVLRALELSYPDVDFKSLPFREVLVELQDAHDVSWHKHPDNFTASFKQELERHGLNAL